MSLPGWVVGVSLVSLLAGPCDVPEADGGSAPAEQAAEKPVSPNQGFVSVNAGLGCAFGGDGTRLCWYRGPTWYSPPPDGPVYMDGPFDFDASLCWIHTDGTLECVEPHGDEIGGDGPVRERFPFPGRVFTALSGGTLACAIDVDGALACTNYGYPVDWAWDGPGAHPTQGRFVSVSAGDPHMCGVRVGGELLCWSDQYYRRRRPEVLSPPGGEFTSVSVGRWHACAVRVGGEVACWGDGSGMHRPPGDAFVALDAGRTATCGLRPDGEAVCWGYDTGFDGEHEKRRLGWEVPAGPFSAISVGYGYACALRPDGEVACWGRGKLPRGYRGEIYEASGENRARLEPPAGPFSAISAYDEFTCGLRPDGEAACWGMHDTYYEIELAAPPAGSFTAIRAGTRRACGLRPSGEAICWNAETGALTATGGPLATLPDGRPQPCGLRAGGEFTCSDPDTWGHQHAPKTAFQSVASRTHTCGLDFGGEITCWSGRVWHEPTPPGPFTAVTVGDFHTCGLRPDGTAECWTPHWPPTADPAL